MTTTTSPPPPVDSESPGGSLKDKQRRNASERMRRHRAAKQAEASNLRAEVDCLEARLATLQLEADVRRRQLKRHAIDGSDQALRDHVMAQTSLAHTLYHWVRSQVARPQPGLTERPSWREMTLLGDPAARRQGFPWLSDRVYHTAMRTRPASNPIATSADDAMSFCMHTATGEDGHVHVTATELHMHSIVFAPFDVIGDACWHFMAATSFGTTSTMTCGVVETPDRNLIYDYGVNPRNGSTVRRIMRMYTDDAARIVITYAKVAHDNLFPLHDGELRSHGMGWTIIEPVTDGISVVRHSVSNFVPVTSHGPISLREMGHLFALPPTTDEMIQKSEALYLEQLHAAAQVAHVDEIQAGVRAFRAQLETRQRTLGVQ
ncbi:Aste57867_2605 [Aphanomyces stellatus]|uniref:Aste57867_2605 protein n=1 Tax=Aphanomyces stellatus TaxID=120398 RepID=A0A485KD40_9STRA|nr:hypothetical protein As57867_002598 [Aphanomyces stellatus]VFT79801.1 Aste57867_2605 [Aphanomyces stellatus]